MIDTLNRAASRKSVRTCARLAGAAVVIAGLSACATPAPPPPTPLIDALAQAATRATAAQERLARIEQARNAVPEIKDAPGVPDEMNRPISMEWAGPVGPLAKKLAEAAGYSYAQLGTAPASAVTVDVLAVQTPLYKILQDAGMQASGRADIVVNVAERRIEVRYGR